MKTYLEAYRERLERNHNTLISLAEQAKEKGFLVYAPKNGFIKFIKIFNEGNHILIGFNEVPYKWYADITLDHRKGNGSSRNVKENYDLENGFTLSEVVELMQPYPFSVEPEKLDKQLHYLKRI